jgi:ATP-binding cassette, subfamily C, bacterial
MTRGRVPQGTVNLSIFPPCCGGTTHCTTWSPAEAAAIGGGSGEHGLIARIVRESASGAGRRHFARHKGCPGSHGPLTPTSRYMLNRDSVDLLRYFVRAYPRRSALMVLLLILSGLAEGVGVVTLLPLLDLAVADQRESSGISQVLGITLGRVGLSPSLPILLGLIVAGMSLKAAFLWLAMKQVGYTVARIATDLRLMLLRALMRARWSYFASQSAGQVANSISNEAHRAAGAYRELCFLLAGVVQILIYITIAVLVSWQVALFALVGGFMILFALRELVGRGRAAGGQETLLLKSLVGRVTDALHGLKAIKAMGKEEHLLPMLERETIELNRAIERGVLARETMRAMQEPLLVMLLAVGLFAMITFGNEPFAAVLVLAFLFYRMATHFNKLQSHYQTMATCESAFWSMRERAANAEGQAEQRTIGPAAPLLRQGIRFESVNFSFGETTILDSVSFDIPAGRFVAITGPSGVGKTTLVDLVVGLHRPEGGRILVDGQALDRLDLMAWRRGIGYVPQETLLLHDTILHNVTLGDPEVGREAAWEALEQAGVANFVRGLSDGLETVVGEGGSRLSGGQRQRIAIARALVSRPALLILDEVTTALDPDTEAAICATLRALSGKVTIVAISHQPAISEAADLRYRLDAGQIYGPGSRSGHARVVGSPAVMEEPMAKGLECNPDIDVDQSFRPSADHRVTLAVLAPTFEGTLSLVVGGEGSGLSRSIGWCGGQVIQVGSERARRAAPDSVRVCASPAVHLPFRNSSFDSVFIDDWLGRLPAFVPEEVSPHAAQVAFLRECRRVLKPGGRLLMTTPNRAGLPSWGGRPDRYTGLSFVALAPRAVADAWSRIIRRRPFREHIYGMVGNMRLLRSAGFQAIRVHAPWPHHHWVQFVIPNVTASDWRDLTLPASAKGRRRTTAMLGFLGRLGMHVRFLPDYYFEARAGEAGKDFDPTRDDSILAQILKRARVTADRALRIRFRATSSTLVVTTRERFIKIPVSDPGVHRLRAEVAALRRLAAHRLGRYTLGPGELGIAAGVAYASYPFFPHEEGENTALRRIETAFNALFHEPHYAPLSDTAFWKRIIASDSLELMERVGAGHLLDHWLPRLARKRVPVGVSHGDLNAGNLLEGGQRLVMIDWDFFEESSPLFLDAMHAVFRLALRESNSGVPGRRRFVDFLELLYARDAVFPLLRYAVSLLGELTWEEAVTLYVLSDCNRVLFNLPDLERSAEMEEECRVRLAACRTKQPRLLKTVDLPEALAPVLADTARPD